MLLIVDEMLIQMGIDPENVQGYEDAKLAGMVEHRMILLRTEMEHEETLLIELINSKRRSKFASACDTLRSNLVIFFCCDVWSSKESVLSANKEKHPSLQKVSEFINGMVLNWHSCTTVGRKPTLDEVDLQDRLNLISKKELQDRLDLISKERWAELGIE